MYVSGLAEPAVTQGKYTCTRTICHANESYVMQTKGMPCKRIVCQANERTIRLQHFTLGSCGLACILAGRTRGNKKEVLMQAKCMSCKKMVCHAKNCISCRQNVCFANELTIRSHHFTRGTYRLVRILAGRTRGDTKEVLMQTKCMSCKRSVCHTNELCIVQTNCISCKRIHDTITAFHTRIVQACMCPGRQNPR